jgi:hypothetical protein
MAKKNRTPTPPRPVQAPKRRYEPTTGGLSRRAKYYAIAAAVVLVAGGAIAVAANRGGGSAEVAKKLASAGCTFKTYPNLGQKHVQSVTAKVAYNSFPPTSGPHYFQPAPWNFYDGPVDSQVRAVHNLEHGGIVVQWGSKVAPSTVEQLRSFWQASPNAMLMAPLPKLGGKIALTAWTHLATCSGFNGSAFKAFRDAYRGKGPERFPVSQLTPGT